MFFLNVKTNSDGHTGKSISLFRALESKLLLNIAKN
jgi:hypothetical protein